MEASFKKKEGFVYKKLLDKRKKPKPNIQITISFELLVQRELSQKQIQLIGPANCIKLHNLLKIQYQVVALII